MAAGFTIIGSGSVAAATYQTAILLIASGQHPPLITEMGVSFNGTSSTQVPIMVEMVASTQATLGTPGLSPTPTPIRALGDFASLTLAGTSYSAEPTVLTPLKCWFVSPNGGVLVLQFPLGREPLAQIVQGTIGKCIGIRLFNPVGNNAATYKAYVEFES